MASNSGDRQSLLQHRMATLQPYPEARFSGRGLVVCAGGVQMFTNAWVLIHLLRRTLGSLLPIELWHLGPHEMSSGMAQLLEGLDVRVVDASAVLVQHPARIVDGWQLKPYALMHSSFAEVLMLDADQVPVADPAGVFEWKEYLRTGAVFWPDLLDLSPDNQIWSACGLPPSRMTSFESGQLLVDKRRHWRALQICLHLNEEAEHYYRMIYGDKDTFLAAWLLAREEFSLVPHRPFVDSRCLFQRDYDGAVIFQHRTGGKWSYGGEQRRIAGFVHDDACLAALAELRRVWNGRIFHAPRRGLAAEKTETEILQRSPFVLSCAGEPDQFIDFLPGHQLAEGRSLERQNWYVRDGVHERPLLEISDGQSVTFRFEKKNDELWLGHEAGRSQRNVELRPAGDRRKPISSGIRSKEELFRDPRHYLRP